MTRHAHQPVQVGDIRAFGGSVAVVPYTDEHRAAHGGSPSRRSAARVALSERLIGTGVMRSTARGQLNCASGPRITKPRIPSSFIGRSA